MCMAFPQPVGWIPVTAMVISWPESMCIFKVEIGDLLVKIDVKRMAATNQITKIIQDYIYIIYKYIQIYSLVPWPPLLENS